MTETLNLFEKAIRKGTEFFFMAERLKDTGEVQRRYEICKSNSCYDSEKDKCKECGCFMSSKTKMLRHINVKAKGRIEITHCPLIKWGNIVDGKLDFEGEKEIANYYRNLDKKPLII